MPQDSPEYLQKKRFLSRIITVFGRKPVLEMLTDPSIELYRLHLADSNKPATILEQILKAAQTRGVEIQYHSRQKLSRISKNSKQDQGVCIDVYSKSHQSHQDFLQHHQGSCTLLALDRVTNPQNLGMIIRSACAGNIDGILIPSKGSAAISSPLTIKASAGTLFKAPLITCEDLKTALEDCQKATFSVCALSSHATDSVFDYNDSERTIFVLGNESDGVDNAIFALADKQLMIPMNNQVESLNVAITAALIAFNRHLS